MLKVTPSLLNDYNWFKNCPPSWKERAYNSFSKTLNREFVTSPEIELGKKFEDCIMYSIKSGKNGSEKFNEIRDYFLNVEFQKRTKMFLNVEGEEFGIFGRIDAYKPDLLLDIKTTSNYKGKDHYLNTWQHKIYCYSEKIKNFEYIIVELLDKKIIDYYIVKYEMEDFDGVRKEIQKEIKEMICFIDKDKNLKDLYYNKYNTRR